MAMSKHQSVRPNIRPSLVSGEANNEVHQASSKSLFAFTNIKHLAVLIPAILLTILAGALKPAITILLGCVFDELSSFGAGNATGNKLQQNVSIWCIALTGLGVATMVVNGVFFSLWMVFGEMQARSVRDKAFVSMLEKEMEWYDLRAEGIGPLLVRIQTCVKLEFNSCVVNNQHIDRSENYNCRLHSHSASSSKTRQRRWLL